MTISRAAGVNNWITRSFNASQLKAKIEATLGHYENSRLCRVPRGVIPLGALCFHATMLFMKEKCIVVANWKMNPKTLQEAKRLFVGVKKVLDKIRGARTVICPPAIFLTELRELYVGRRIAFGTQNVHMERSGSFTGSLSAPMIKSAGATHVIIGHSERRAEGETDEQVQKKLRVALDERLTPILCVGERERDQHGDYLHFVKTELEVATKGIARDELRRVIIAYEPIWAIGRSARDAMKPHDMHQMSLFIRKVLTEQFSREVAAEVPILYGGSVEPTNAQSLLQDGNINGFLVGHASLDAKTFGDILEIAFSKR